MNFLKPSLLFLLSASLAFTLWSCDDDPTGPDLDDEPDPPSFDQVELELSIFEDSDHFSSSSFSTEDVMPHFETKEEYFTAYEQAAWYAWFAQFYFETMALFPRAYFNQEQWGEPSLDGNTWVWEYAWSYDGESVAFKITAEDTGEAMYWEARYSISTQEENIDNALLISAQDYHDGSGGDWQMYDLMEQDEPVFEFTYELDGDTTTMVDLSFDDQEDGRYLYEREDEISTLTFWDISDGQSVIEWNNETGEGFIESPDYQSGERVCWDENYQNTECS